MSNAYGFYSITAPKNDYFLLATFSGYENDTLKISLTKDKIQDIALTATGHAIAGSSNQFKKNDITQTLPGDAKDFHE